MERYGYDLSHFMHNAGKLGRLQTLQIIPIQAGDSISINLDGIVRLAPLRKEVVSETQVDLCVFYVPHRHVYPDWPTRIQNLHGGTIASPGIATIPGATDLSYLCLDYAEAVIPRWTMQGYNQIWDRYFRVPSLPRDPDELTYPSTSSQDHIDWRAYGRRCARLPSPINDGIRLTGGAATRQPWRDQTSVDYTYQAAVGSGFANIDLRALENIRGRYKSELERTWFTERYKDVLDRQWGTTVNIDADQRPEMCLRETSNMSGADVDGSDDATLGQYIGKTVARVGFNMPRKLFSEHGALWIMALLRHPFVHVGERHAFVYDINQVGSLESIADPDTYKAEAPIPYQSYRWLSPPWGGGADGNITPYGQPLRMNQNRVHKTFADIPGYPFLKNNITTLEQAAYYQTGDYDDVFQTSQLGHWQIHARANVTAMRVVPPASTSIYAGAN